LATIISHRGYWSDPSERNTAGAFERSLALGFGVETDVRDDRGRLVIAHDPPEGGEPQLSDLLRAYEEHGVAGPLAVNVKADGLQALVADAMSAKPAGWFVFDMSVPDALGYARASIPYFTRQSEYEPLPALYEGAAGVWVDCFERDWTDERAVSEHVDGGKEVCLVSPELHGREHASAWELWASWPVVADPRVIVCTDRPQDAAEVLG
jgi:glycerophosphoryl diester phosphodiesterase